MSKKIKMVILFLILTGILLIFIAIFNIENTKFTISFDSNGGSLVASQIVKKRDKLMKPMNPTKDGYIFLYWVKNNKEYDFNDEVKSEFTLKAIWKEKQVSVVKYDITFTLDGKTEKINVSSNSEIDLESLGFEEKEGYEIKWYNEGVEYKFDTPLLNNLILEGKYIPTDNFVVKFNSNGGNAISNQSVKYGEKVVEPDKVSKYGYIFDGWYLNDSKYDFDTQVTKNMVLVAKWSEDPNVERYTVTFDVDGKKTTQVVLVNQVATQPVNPSKTGFNFDGWYLGNAKYDFNTKITSNIVLIAKWIEKTKYVVNFDSDGGSNVESQNVFEDDKVRRPTDPQKNGYKFVEWRLNGETYNFNSLVKNDISLVAFWEKLPSQEEINLSTMIENVTSASLVATSGNINLVNQIPAVNGCTLTVSNFPATIERDVNDKEITVNINIVCGSQSSTKSKKVTISKSPYTYSKVMNENMLNYDVTVNGGNWLGKAKLFLGNSGGFNVFDRKAVVEIEKIKNNPTFKMRFDSDASTIYIVPFK